MKSTSFALALGLLLLLLSSASSSAANSNTVLDVDGHRLRAGVNYYVLPVVRGKGGGLSLAPRTNGSCPLHVIQENHEVANGLPLKFHPANATNKFISLSTDLNVVFDAMTVCVQSTGWQLGDLDESTGRRYVTTGGGLGNPGHETVSNWFKIEKQGDRDYKFVFCPTVCAFCKVICGDVGVFAENGQRWIGLSDSPLEVMFKKIKCNKLDHSKN